MVKQEVLERVVDDFQNKADKFHERSKYYYEKGLYELSVETDGKAHGFEYCAMVLRQALK